MNLLGHEQQLNFFSKAIASGQLSHAYVFVGPEHVGKETLARTVSAQLLKTEFEKLHQHPDFLYVQRIRDAKTEKLHRDITINDIRSVITFASQSPLYEKGHKIIIIAEAERLNIEASNALLKMLEEPPARTIFFLLYKNEAAILPTIYSRSQQIIFLPLTQSQLTSALITQNIPLEQAETLARDSQGLPGLAVTWLEQPEMYQNWLDQKTKFINLFGKSFVDKLQAVEPWFEEAKDEGVGPDLLVERLTAWQGILRGMFLDKQTTDAGWLELNQTITDTIIDLRRNVHPRLAVEAVLLAMP